MRKKTEFTTLSRNDDWKGSKKVGSLIGDKEDVDRRKQLSTSALAKLKNIWIAGDKIKRKTKIKLYKALVRGLDQSSHTIVEHKLKKKN